MIAFDDVWRIQMWILFGYLLINVIKKMVFGQEMS